MPAASVGVATMHFRMRFLNADSTSFLWGFVRPAWWNAHPFFMHLPSLFPRLVASSCSPTSLFAYLESSWESPLRACFATLPRELAKDSLALLALTNTR